MWERPVAGKDRSVGSERSRWGRGIGWWRGRLGVRGTSKGKERPKEVRQAVGCGRDRLRARGASGGRRIGLGRGRLGVRETDRGKRNRSRVRETGWTWKRSKGKRNRLRVDETSWGRREADWVRGEIGWGKEMPIGSE